MSGYAEVRVRSCGGSCQDLRRFVSGFAEVRVRWCGGSCQVLRRFVSGVITAYIARLPSLEIKLTNWGNTH